MATQGEKTFGTSLADVFNVGGRFESGSSSGSTAGRSVSWQGLPNDNQGALSAMVGPTVGGFYLPYVAGLAGFNPESFMPSSKDMPGYRYFPSDAGISGSRGPTGPLRFDQPGDRYGRYDFPGGEQGWDPLTQRGFDPISVPFMNAANQDLLAAQRAAPDYTKKPTVDASGRFQLQFDGAQNVLNRAAAKANITTPDGQLVSLLQRMGPAILPITHEQTTRANDLSEELQQGKIADMLTAFKVVDGLIGMEGFSQTTTQQQESKSSFGIGNIAKLAAIAAAPFTGGASLAALPVIGGIEGGGEGFLRGGLEAGAAYAMGGGFPATPPPSTLTSSYNIPGTSLVTRY